MKRVRRRILIAFTVLMLVAQPTASAVSADAYWEKSAHHAQSVGDSPVMP